MVLALLPTGTHFLLSQGFFPLSLDKIIKGEAGLEEGSHPPFQKKPFSLFSSAEGVAMTTFWRLNSITETHLGCLVESCPLVVKRYCCIVSPLIFTIVSSTASPSAVSRLNVKRRVSL